MMARAAGFEPFEHVADVGIRGFGPTREAAFEQAALALVHVVCDPEAVAPAERIEIRCPGDDLELLLVDWLNALVFEIATRGMLFARFAVRFDGAGLTGEAWGEPIDPARHDLAVEIKGATMTALRVTREDGGTWIAQCVVDV